MKDRDPDRDLKPLKKLIFYSVLLSPAIAVSALAIFLVFFTNLPQVLYRDSIRNIYFDCTEFNDDDYVYKMRPGKCQLSNIEFDTVITHDSDGFRNDDALMRFDVAVLGDSHAHGFGVGDSDTFAHLLKAGSRNKVRNLAIASYATMRELDVLKQYGQDAKYIVLQYCENDPEENEASLRLDKEEFKRKVESGWKAAMNGYNRGKEQGAAKPLRQLFVMIRNRWFGSKTIWRAQSIARRNLQSEAALFAQIVTKYQELLEGKRLLIFESASYGFNSPTFEAAFKAELSQIAWLHVRIIDTSKLLDSSHYYFLDDHLNRRGHMRLAGAISEEIKRWEDEIAILDLKWTLNLGSGI